MLRIEILYHEAEGEYMNPYKRWQAVVDGMFLARGWRYWSALSIGGRLMEEVGELAREVNHHFGDKEKRIEEAMGSIELEIGDVAYTLICLANSIDYAIGESHVRTRGYDTERSDPMSMLNRLGGHVGKLLHSLDEQHTRATICSRISIVMRSLQQLTEVVDLRLDVAIKKSIQKVIDRDKDRFPKGI